MESSLKVRQAKACSSKNCKWCDIDARVGDELKKLHAAVLADREAKCVTVEKGRAAVVAKITSRRSLKIPTNVAKPLQQGSCNESMTLADREATLDKGPAVVVPSAKQQPKPSVKNKPSAKRKRTKDLARLLERKREKEEVQEVEVQEDSATSEKAKTFKDHPEDVDVLFDVAVVDI